MNDYEIDNLIKKIDDKIAELDREHGVIPEKPKVLNTVNMDAAISDIFNRLNNLVGLDDVKKEVKRLFNYLSFVRKTNGAIKLGNLNLNMIFRGNPGTGKTTVARIIADVLKTFGFLSSSVILETTPRDFIGEYVGHTAIKAKNLIDRATGGVIFIDEAYTFSKSAEDGSHTFVHEAMAEIIKEMEKRRTVFIFAGYSSEMDEFIDLNPGLKSRIGYDISFKDYNRAELFEMFNRKIKNSNMKIDDDARETILKLIDSQINTKNFGNGRMIDNLFDEVLREHASVNAKETDINKLLLITNNSIKDININKKGGNYFE